MLIGGAGSVSVELFPRPHSDTCSIPDLPSPRSSHSVSILSNGTLVVCGGEDDDFNAYDFCIGWRAGDTSWSRHYNLRCQLPINPRNVFFKIKSQRGEIGSHGLDAALPSRLDCAAGRLGKSTKVHSRDCARYQRKVISVPNPFEQAKQHFH